ncbi:MAG: hypothetical protein ABR511_06830 [Acidimicrobiales bacterium]
MSWRAVDAEGRDLATGRPPSGPGCPTPAAALAATPVAPWPLQVVDDGGRHLTLAGALGPGGSTVGALLDALAATPEVGEEAGLEALARATPGGPVALPVAVVALDAGVEAAGRVDGSWLARAGAARDDARRAVLAAGRHADLEAAVHVAMLVATERLDPPDDADVAAHVASGARLWLLAGAVASALAGVQPDPFAGWARLVAAGWWPVGPSGGRLVVAAPARQDR